MTPLTPEESEDLLKEKSLWDIYKLSFKLPFPFWAATPPLLLSIALLIFGLITQVNISLLSQSVREILALGTTYSSTLLGFLIAGFTIIATLTNPAIFIKIAKVKNNDSGLSWLKHIYVVFMHVFIHYTAFLVASISLQMFSQPKGLLSWIIEQYACNPTDVKRGALVFALAFFPAWILYLLLLLGRFIFNIYHALMFSLAIQGEDL